MKHVSYDASTAALILDNGIRLQQDDSGEGFIASLSDVEDLSLTSLRHALARSAADYGASDSRLVVVDMPRSRLDDDILIDPVELVWVDGGMRVRRDFASADEPASVDELLARLSPVLTPRRTVVSLDREPQRDFWVVTVEMTVNTHGQAVKSAISLATDAEALMTASVDDRSGVASLVRAGQAHLLIGSYESDWLEVKRAPYRDEPSEDLELAKDVAALANGIGGLLLIGLKTKKDPEGDRIQAVNECPLDPSTARRYHRVVKKHIYPTVDGLAIDLVPGSSTDRGVMIIEVPAQADGSRPFLVHGIVRDGRVEGAYVGLPTRAGADTDFLDIKVLHGRLRAGTRFLAGIDEPPAAKEGAADQPTDDLEARIERLLFEASVPDFLREVVASAQRHGFSVERARESIAFNGPRGGPVVVPSSSSGPLADQGTRQSLLEQLQTLGLPVRTTARGFLVPVD